MNQQNLKRQEPLELLEAEELLAGRCQQRLHRATGLTRGYEAGFLAGLRTAWVRLTSPLGGMVSSPARAWAMALALVIGSGSYQGSSWGETKHDRTREVRFVQASLERKHSHSVPDASFRPESELAPTNRDRRSSL